MDMVHGGTRWRDTVEGGGCREVERGGGRWRERQRDVEGCGKSGERWMGGRCECGVMWGKCRAVEEGMGGREGGRGLLGKELVERSERRARLNVLY